MSAVETSCLFQTRALNPDKSSYTYAGAQFKVAPDIVASVCCELGLTPEDMEKFVAEEHEAAKTADLRSGAAREVHR